jgi:hypothetical protein
LIVIRLPLVSKDLVDPNKTDRVPSGSPAGIQGIFKKIVHKSLSGWKFRFELLLSRPVIEYFINFFLPGILYRETEDLFLGMDVCLLEEPNNYNRGSFSVHDKYCIRVRIISKASQI